MTLANRFEIAPVCTRLQECAGVWLSLGAWRLPPSCRPRLSVTTITDTRGRQAARVYQAFPTRQVVYTLERQVRGK